MATKQDKKSGRFFSAAAKSVRRRQEQLIQKMGKAASTTSDEEHQEHVANFTKQQNQATRLAKESANYMKALKAMAVASQGLGEAIKAVYEPELPNSEETYEGVDAVNLMYQELLEQLQDQLVAPLNGYLQRFPDVKARIQKRDRRALDFDRTKRMLDNAKEKGSSKVGATEEAFQEAETLFNEINSEIHDLLPSFYHGRIAFYASILQSLYTTESGFYKKAEEKSEELRLIMDVLLEEEARNPVAEVSIKKDGEYIDDEMIQGAKSDPTTETNTEASAAAAPKPTPVPRKQEEAPAAEAEAEAEAEPEPVAPVPATEAEAPEADEGGFTRQADVIEVRLATHVYAGQDEDELTLAPGDVIHVIPTPPDEEEEDPDEGWGHGRLISGKEGAFPMNFTKLQE